MAESLRVSRAVQGNCTDPVHLLPASAPLRPRQCVLMTDERILEPTLAKAPHLLWWDNIYVVMRPNPRSELILPLSWDHPGNKLWATNSTFEGDHTNSTALTALRGSNVYGGGAQRSELTTAWCSSTCVWIGPRGPRTARTQLHGRVVVPWLLRSVRLQALASARRHRTAHRAACASHTEGRHCRPEHLRDQHQPIRD